MQTPVQNLSCGSDLLLRGGLRRGTLPGACLIHGSEREERARTAAAIAMALNCPTPGKERNLGGCGTCLSCRKIAAGHHPDVRVLHPEGDEMTIDRVREIQQDMAYRPLEGKKKVYIFEESDRMNPQTANALLKALEEPPPDVHFILLAERAHTLLPTLLSRCQKLSIHETGSRKPGNLAENRSAAIPDEIDSFLSRGFQGTARIFDFAEKTAKGEGTAETFFHSLEIFLRDCLVRGVSKDDSLLLRPTLQTDPVPFDADELHDLLQSVRTIRRGLERNVNKRLAIESILLRLEAIRKPGGSS